MNHYPNKLSFLLWGLVGLGIDPGLQIVLLLGALQQHLQLLYLGQACHCKLHWQQQFRQFGCHNL
jgi:hypothetical protein